MIFTSRWVFIKSMMAGKQLFTAPNPTMVHDKLELVSIPLVKLGMHGSPRLLPHAIDQVLRVREHDLKDDGEPLATGTVWRECADGADNA